MERKTKLDVEDGRNDIIITREFDLPVDLLFRAHAEADIVEQWMGNKVVKLEPRQHGGWHFQIHDPQGNLVFDAHGAFHDFVPDQRITRTFEMQNTKMGVHLEFLEFEKLTDDTSKLTMHIIYRSAQHRAEQLKLPFAMGINMAHNHLQEVLEKLK